LQALPGVDPARVGLFGGSYGGFLTAMALARDSDVFKAGVDWQLISYGGTVHSFTNPTAAAVGNPGIAYNKSADERSWQAMRNFFSEIFAA